MKKLFFSCMSFLLALSLSLFSACDLFSDKPQSIEEPKLLEGKTISILGDSNASFAGQSNSNWFNSTLGNNYSFFPKYDISDHSQAWWSLVAQETGAEIFVNNSSSGAKASGDRFDNGWQDRCVQLHCDLGERENEEPDIIFVRLGENDFYGGVPYGGFENLSDVWSEENGYKTPETYTQALAIIVHKILNRYKNADIFLFTLSYRKDCEQLKLELYNEEIRTVARYFGVNVIEWYGYGRFDPDIHTSDGIHYNQLGMQLVSKCVVKTLTARYKK